MSNNPKISIIVPVYNVEDYMALSLDSLRKQTLEDIEIVCIDDGSPDRSGEILDMYAKLDSRFKVIHTQNGGVSTARNIGMDNACGEYICFFDPDDLMVPHACETILKTFEKTGADLVTYGGYPYPEMYGYPWLNDVLTPRDVIYDKFDPAVLMREKTRPFVWKTACRREFLDKAGVRFNTSLALGEDQVFLFALFPRSSKSTIISDKLIKYRAKREGSVMFDRANDKSTRIREHIQIIDCILDDWESQGLLDIWSQEIFDWNIEFLIHDIFAGYDESEQAEVSGYLSEVWRKHFSEEFLETRKHVRRYGRQVQIIMNGEDRPSASEQKMLLFRYHMAEYGLGNAITVAMGNVRRSLKGSKKDPEPSHEEELWKEADEKARADALRKIIDQSQPC